MEDLEKLKVRAEFAGEIIDEYQKGDTSHEKLLKVFNYVTVVLDKRIKQLEEKVVEPIEDNLSCCGDILDEDNMICPKCGEHN